MLDSNIQLSHLPEVDEIDLAKIESVFSSVHDKLCRILNNKILLRAHFKDEKKMGVRKKHFVKLHLSSPGLEIAASSDDWNLITAIQGALENLEREVMKKIRA